MGILLVVVLLLIIVVLFSVQNASPVAVTFLFWSFDASLAVVIFLSLVVGIVLGAVVVLGARRTRKGKAGDRDERSPPDPGPAGTPTF